MTNPSDLDSWSPQGPVTELADDHSREFLAAASFGRLALSVDEQPEIFPVDYHFDGSSVLFRTAEGTKLSNLLVNSAVAFEIDAREQSSAWSVVVKGRAVVVTEQHEIDEAETFPLPVWVPTAEYVWVRVVPASLRGRRFSRHVQATRA